MIKLEYVLQLASCKAPTRSSEALLTSSLLTDDDKYSLAEQASWNYRRRLQLGETKLLILNSSFDSESDSESKKSGVNLRLRTCLAS